MPPTVYQSKFVLVGGCDPSTGKSTDVILTSATGHQWAPLLPPPMPTKHCYISSVSTGSPKEVLVVAGGRGSNHEELDVVEVL